MMFHPTPIAGLWAVQTQPRGDERGSLTRLFCTHEFARIQDELRFVQSNLSRTAQKGAVRGMHFQRGPALEAKLIRCLRGRVFDVAVDLRAGSETFGQWHAIELSQDNEAQVFIPPGCAHGFQALSDHVELLYQHTHAYSPAHEDGARYDDPALAIAWPLPVTQVSDRDQSHPAIGPGFQKVIV